MTLILGILIWKQWPSSSTWVIGTLVGISLVFSGVSRFLLAFSLRGPKALVRSCSGCRFLRTKETYIIIYQNQRVEFNEAGLKEVAKIAPAECAGLRKLASLHGCNCNSHSQDRRAS